MDSVQAQYEKYPYPPVPVMALPKSGQGAALSFVRGSGFVRRFIDPNFHAQPKDCRILVVGCGTLEASVVAMNHPSAQLITAIDFSASSIERAQKRWQLMKFARWLTPWRRLPKLEFIQTDLFAFEPEHSFDYIVATHVLHHLPEPAKALHKLASWLKSDGLLRLATYPRQSRIWMRRTAAYLQGLGLNANDENLLSKSQAAIDRLPAGDAIKSNFTSCSESQTLEGLVDAFFHACENPLAPLQWHQAAQASGLTWVAEDQRASSQSAFLDDVLPETKPLAPWVKLQILDDLLEVCDNPVLWFLKRPFEKSESVALDFPVFEPVSKTLKAELESGLKRVDQLLLPCGIDAKIAIERLREQVGARYTADGKTELPGMSIGEWMSELG